jgi:hypothetical protein
LSKFGKYLLERQDEARQHNKELGFRVWDDELYTPMRYVSEQELNEARKQVRSWINPSWIDGWVRAGQYVAIIRESGFGMDGDGYIYKPGFYRVKQKRRDTGDFVRVCADGIPLHWRNATKAAFDDYMQKREQNGRILQQEKTYRKALVSQRKAHVIRAARFDRESAAFFRTIAMAGAVSEMANIAR